jgi:hypothetical protein
MRGDSISKPQKLQMHFPVADVDAEYDRLSRLGLKFDELPEDRPPWDWRHDYPHDPVGHKFELCTALPSALRPVLDDFTASALRRSTKIAVHGIDAGNDSRAAECVLTIEAHDILDVISICEVESPLDRDAQLEPSHTAKQLTENLVGGRRVILALIDD